MVKGENNKFRIRTDNIWANEWIQTINLALQQNNVQISSLNYKKSSKTITPQKTIAVTTGNLDHPNDSILNNSDKNRNVKKSDTNGCTGCDGCSSLLGNSQNLSEKSQSQYIIEKPVRFLGGDKSIPDPTDGNLMLSTESILFKDNQSGIIEIPLEKIKQIEIVDDKYTPSLKRGLIMGILGGDTESQSFRPHKSVLKISYQTEKRIKDIEFNFSAITWAGSVEDCQQFYSKLNALLD